MDTFTIIVGSILELIALYVMAKVWRAPRWRGWRRILVSIILLIPFFGLLIYVFLKNDLAPNPGYWETQADTDATNDSGHGHS
jgi:hypothetical protein